MDFDATIESIFTEEGCLKNILPFYEYRESQKTMGLFLEKCLLGAENALIEAGTGTGKTMAYLLPLLKYSMETGKKVAVSTETKALQKQLLEKDIPCAEKVMKELYGYDVKTSLCLGSSNYPCRSRFTALAEQGAFLFGGRETMEEISYLFAEKEVFTYDDTSADWELWSSINREPESCRMNICSHRSECVYCRVRNEWNRADVLVMNHYLFFTNLKSGKTFLPQFDVIVFDEAHSLETVASTQMGFEINKKFTGDLVARIRKGKTEIITDKITDVELRKILEKEYMEIAAEIPRFFSSLEEKLSGKMNIRLKKGFPEGENFLKALEVFYENLKKADSDFDENEFVRMEYDALMSRIFALYQGLNMAVYGFEEDWVYWIESVRSEISLLGQPIDIRSIMRTDVYDFYESCFFVSATLTVNGSFTYMTDKLGLDGPEKLKLESPFNYRENCRLYIPDSDIEPQSPDYARFVAMVTASLVRKSGGRTLVLFTSYKMLEECRNILKGIVDCEIYSQEGGSASRAINSYRENMNSVLLGTHSFWQGIDLQGDMLKNLVITRLPFAVPDRPAVEARIEKITENGGNSFYDFQIPEAVIKFKQGFGRLIRSGTDSGIVAVLDNRISRKNYGKFFLNSLPQCRIIRDVEKF